MWNKRVIKERSIKTQTAKTPIKTSKQAGFLSDKQEETSQTLDIALHFRHIYHKVLDAAFYYEIEITEKLRERAWNCLGLFWILY